MKKKILPLLLALLIILAGCGKKDKVKTATPENPPQGEENVETVEGEEKAPEEKAEAKEGEAAAAPEENAETSAEGTEESAGEVLTPKEKLEAMIAQSNYISRIRVNQESDGKLTPIFLQDFKGDLSAIEYELPATLQANQEYLVFLKDGEDGSLQVVDGESSYMPIGQESDTNLKMVEERFNTGQ